MIVGAYMGDTPIAKMYFGSAALHNATYLENRVKSMFEGGKQGLFYDPSELTTMFKDSEGTQPVTADGDPVGLILDKSQGLVLGSNKTDTWVADFVFSGGVVNPSKLPNRIIGTTSTSSNVLGSFTIANTVAGDLYEVTLTSYNTNNITLASIGDTGLAASYSRQTGARTRYFRATKDSSSLLIQVRAAGASESLDFGLITIRQLKGNHTTQSVSAARPIYRTDGVLHWLESDGVDDTFVVNTTIALSAGFFVAGAFAVTKFGGVAGLSSYMGLISGIYSQGLVVRATAAGAASQLGGVIRSPAFGDAQYTVSSGNAFTLNTAFVHSAEHSGATLTSTKNKTQILGTAQADVSNSSVANGEIFLFSKSHATRFYGGLFIANSVSSSDKDLVHTYLAAKAGVTL